MARLAGTLARIFAFVLVHFCDSVTMAKVERAIIEEVLSRSHHARAGHPSPAQWLQRFATWKPFTRWRTRLATRRLYRTLDRWRFEGGK